MLVFSPRSLCLDRRVPAFRLPRTPAFRLEPPRRPTALPRPLVLVVEGAPGSRAALAGLLDTGGCDTQAAASGDEAFAQLELICPDVILLDAALPGDDGYAVCRRLQADERWRRTPVLLLGARGDAGNRLRGFEAGATDCLSRPLHARELLARVRAHARTGSALRTLEKQNAALQAELAARREHDEHLQRSLDHAVITGTGSRVGFCTPSARDLLERFFPAHRTRGSLPPALAGWLASGDCVPFQIDADGDRLTVRLQGASGAHRYLLTLEESCLPSPHHGAARLARLGLTPRESEVLYWIAHGKTNPETGIILEAASNTIKKHMQSIMLKLGVETRLAAASRALEVIGLS